MQFCTVSLQNWCKQSVFTRSTGCRFEPVATGFYRSGSERFSFFRRLELQLKVQSFPVQSGLSPVFFRSYRPDFKTLFMTQNQTVAKSSGCKDDCKGNGCKTHEASTSSTPAQRWGRSMDKEKCYYCGGMGHFQADCEELKTHVRQGSVKVNPEAKLRLKDGSFIPNQPAGATIKERVDRHYARRPSQYFYGEYEDDDPVTTAAPKYASQYLNSSDDAERRLARREAELELKQREDALELRRRKLELEEKKLEQSSEPSRMANLLDVLGQLTEDDLAAIKVARSGFP